jgi:hypothetical protein
LKYFHEYPGFQETLEKPLSYRGKEIEPMHQPIINALIAAFLALGTAVSDETAHRAGQLLRDLIADGVVDRETADILDRLIIAVDAEPETPALLFVFEELATIH